MCNEGARRKHRIYVLIVAASVFLPHSVRLRLIGFRIMIGLCDEDIMMGVESDLDLDLDLALFI